MPDQLFLQAFQAGANLYDRAQNRKMEQAQLENNFRQQASQMLIQQQASDLNTKVQNVKLLEASMELGERQRELETYAAELPVAKQYSESVSRFMADPEKTPFPQAPILQSKQLSGQIQQMNSEAVKYGPAAAKQKQFERNMLIQSQYDLDKLRTGTDLFAETGINPVVRDPKTGDFVVDEVKFAEAQKKKEVADLRKGMTGTAGNMMDIDAMVAAGEMSPEAGEKIKSSMGGGGKSFTQVNIDNAVASEVELARLKGTPKTEVEIAELRAALSRNKGGLTSVPAKILTDTDGKMASSEVADRVISSVDEWEKKYNRSFSSEFLGLMNKPLKQIETKITEEKDPIKKEAIQIIATFAGQRNGVLKTQSGATVTEPEAERLAREIGDEADKNTLIRLAAFAKNNRLVAASTISRNSSYNWPEPYREFAKKQGAAPSANTAPASTNGLPVQLNGGTFIIRKKQ